MSKKTHQKELARARAKRQAERRVEKTRRNWMWSTAAIVVIAALAVVWNVFLRGGDEPGAVIDDDPATATDAPTTTPTDGATATEGTTSAIAPCENPGEGAPEPDTSGGYDAPPPADDVADAYRVTIETTCGTIVAELDGAMAPQTVASFVFLAEEGFYAGVPFHRVKNDFVIQGGDPTGTGTGGPGYTFDDELELAQQVVDENDGLYPRGTLAMANSGPNTNGSQFFIVQADPGYAFPPNYAVFGRVVEGMDVVDRIAQGPVEGPGGDLAVDPVRMISVTVEPVQ